MAAAQCPKCEIILTNSEAQLNRCVICNAKLNAPKSEKPSAAAKPTARTEVAGPNKLTGVGVLLMTVFAILGVAVGLIATDGNMSYGYAGIGAGVATGLMVAQATGHAPRGKKS